MSDTVVRVDADPASTGAGAPLKMVVLLDALAADPAPEEFFLRPGCTSAFAHCGTSFSAYEYIAIFVAISTSRGHLVESECARSVDDAS